MARNRQMADVPTADVVLVNPTHVAVALRYDPEKGAPRVVAKGAGRDRPEDPRAGHRAPHPDGAGRAAGPGAGRRACEVGQEIPAEFYGAVAKVLAFVMSLKSRGSAAGVHRNPNPTARTRMTARFRHGSRSRQSGRFPHIDGRRHCEDGSVRQVEGGVP